MTAPAPFFAGLHCRMLFIQDNAQVVLETQKVEIKTAGTKANDGVNGEPRNRHAFYVDGYEISVTAWLTDLTPVKALLRNQQNEDASALPLTKAFGIVVFPPNSAKAAINADEVTIDDWSWSIPGRTERSLITVPMRARFLKDVRTF